MARTLIRPNAALEKGLATAGDAPHGFVVDRAELMSFAGTARRTGALLGVLLLAAVGGWSWLPISMATVIVLALAAVVVGVAAMRNPANARRLGFVYAVVEGALVGAISRVYESAYNGIVLQAISLTVLVFIVLLAIYSTGVINVTENFKLGIAAATGGVMLLYLIQIVMVLLGGDGLSFISGNGPLSIAVSVLICALAAATLVVDFDFIEKAIEGGAPAEYEWVAGVGLMVSLVWLYLELLRLLAKLQTRD